MNKQIKALYEEHVAHELACFDGQQLQTDISLEITHFLEAVAELKVKDITNAEHIQLSLRRQLTEPRLKAACLKLIKQTVLALYQHEIHDQTTIAELLDEEQVNQWIKYSLGHNELRETIIHYCVSSEIYHHIVTDLLYSGISSYLTQSAALTEKVPGAKTMMRMSKGLINKAAPKLEEKVETQVKKYLNANIGDLIAQSEAFLTQGINEEHLTHLGQGIWQSLKNVPLSKARDYISEQDIDAYVELIYQQYIDSRQAPYLLTLLDQVVQSSFDFYANKKIATLLKDWDISAARIEQEAQLYLPELIKALKQQGYVEQRIRARLARFYERDDLSSLIEA